MFFSIIYITMDFYIKEEDIHKELDKRKTDKDLVGKVDKNFFYTSLEDAKKEIIKRNKDKNLVKKVNDFLGKDIPEPFKKGEPVSVLIRCIATPDKEYFNFLSEANKIGFRKFFIEYPQDKFVSKNFDKYSLCYLHFDGINKKNYDECDKLKLVDFNKYDGHPFENIKTLWNTNLVDFHHDLFFKSGYSIEIYNFWEWFNKSRFKDEYYYLHYLSLFVCNGILFDNFLFEGEESDFTYKKFIPSFMKVVEKFGVKPIICPVTPIEDEDNFRWWLYPDFMFEITRKYIDNDLK
jgi:hypothetical protein